jgi:hypothetical protein
MIRYELEAQIKQDGEWEAVAWFHGSHKRAVLWFKELLDAYREAKPEMRVIRK